jgi:PAS domain S-box-containing protein
MIADHQQTSEPPAGSAARRWPPDPDKLLPFILDTAGMGMWQLDLLTHELSWSPNLVWLHGIDPDAFGRSFEGFLGVCVHPDDRARTIQVVQHALQTGNDTTAEMRVVRPDGAVRWHLIRAHVFCDAVGQPLRMVGLVLDITERKQAEEALRESEARFQAFMNNSPAVAFMKDEAGRYVYVSRSPHTQIGRTPEELIGKTDFDFWPPDIGQQQRDNDAAVLASGKLSELIETVIGKDGSPRHCLVFKFPFQDGSGQRLLGGVAVDMTERIQAQQKLREYATQLQALSRRLVQVQEDERRHLARELHDEVGQALTSLRFALEGARATSIMEKAKLRLDDARAVLEDVLIRIRNLSYSMRPAMLDHLGLLAALSGLIEHYTARTQVQVSFEQQGLDQRLAPELETTAYRIVQEALTNVARHSGVKEAAVRLWIDDVGLNVQVEDQGAGFDPEAVLGACSSSGLPGMRERVQLVGGQLLIESAPGSGTHLLVQLPLRERPQETNHEPCNLVGR